MLFYSILHSLRCAAYVPTITVAHVLINDQTLLLGRHDIFADRWKHLSCGNFPQVLCYNLYVLNLSIRFCSATYFLEGVKSYTTDVKSSVLFYENKYERYMSYAIKIALK